MYQFVNLDGMKTTGTATIKSVKFGDVQATAITDADNYFVYPFDEYVDNFEKITIEFTRRVSSGDAYEDFTLFGENESILLISPHKWVSSYDCQILNIPNNINYSITSNAHVASNGGLQYICSNSTYFGNWLQYTYTLTKSSTSCTQVGGGYGYMGYISKGLQKFGGFGFNKRGTGDSGGVALCNIKITIE